ncbi:twin-arginine translocation signal domain-containing protein [uncultured Flavobacterium sp.]|uniref:twin-arginine translocation signal domain-containing protein n=1 Tax=uncultured Flavobacterium sp. TaxID=165435 RepID=UPI00259304ED|nr:twin-arginine translocation signal domain-containing protein [uncultured Flavobacterium sp.]
MLRRDFLKLLGLGAVTVATPKFIFDYGANLYKRESLIEIPDDDEMLHYGDCSKYNLTTYGNLFKEKYLRLSRDIYNQSHPCLMKMKNFGAPGAVIAPIKF